MPSSLPVAALAQAARTGQAVRVVRAPGSAPALLVAEAEIDGPLLWVTPDDAEAARVASELAAFSGRPVHRFPAWDVKPYKGWSPSADVIRQRLSVLARLALGQPLQVVAPASAVLARVLPAAALREHTAHIKVGEDLDRDTLLLRLVERGYLATDLCADPGTFARRGHILDVFPPGESAPLRIELWGDEVESIRSFDPWTQRSTGSRQDVVLPPVCMAILDEGARARLPGQLKRLADARGLPPKHRIAIQRELQDSGTIPEIELLLPLLAPQLVPVFDLIAGGLLVWQQPEAIASRLMGHDGELQQQYERSAGRERLLPEPAELFLDEAALAAATSGVGRLVLPELADADEPPIDLGGQDPSALRAEVLASKDRPEGMLHPLVRRLGDWSRAGRRVAVVGRRPRLEALAALLEPYSVSTVSLDGVGREARESLPIGALGLLASDVSRGLDLPGAGLVLVAAEELLGPKKRETTHARRPPGSEPIGSLAQLQRGDLIVHTLHGIGRFERLTKLQLDAGALQLVNEARERVDDPDYKPGSGGRLGQGRGNHNDFLELTYRGGDRLYLPVHKLGQLSRYINPGGKDGTLDKLGGTTWAKKRGKVSAEVQKIAAHLLSLYAKRATAVAHAFDTNGELFAEFVAAFPFTETPDQQAAINAVLGDLAKPHPTDRLICGDVGFGKTEVAMRAAFVAVEEGKQVAVLVPTTILALQHFEAFKERMAAFPVTVAMLSRFRTTREQTATLKKLKAGEIDVVIGTHRLLSQDVKFAELGLLVVDEEHRFGVKHKERIKEIRAGVDAMTMSATPIPRTLHMALTGLRDLSIITTPPEGRQPVHTAVARYSKTRVIEAIRAERERNGQVFYLHNRVQTIWKEAEDLRKMMPELRLRVAHGQMSERELEDIMLAFFAGDFDVLVSTTIIESGLDVPRANTIIIDRAHTLGLAQLHQLRGRVGRSRQQGYCLLLVPPQATMSTVAVQRLRVIQDHTELGAGHRIAQRDLELRGAGNLLGSKQSGHIASVGLATYTDLLEDAVRKLRGQAIAARFEPDIDLKTDAWIPGDYIPDERERLAEYKRLADASSQEQLADLFEALEDRWGHPPPEVLAFEQLIEVKVACLRLRVSSVKMLRGGRMKLTFAESTTVDPARLLGVIAAGTRPITFKPDGSLLARLEPEERKQPVASALALLAMVAECVDDTPAVAAAAPEPPRPSRKKSTPPPLPDDHAGGTLPTTVRAPAGPRPKPARKSDRRRRTFDPTSRD